MKQIRVYLLLILLMTLSHADSNFSILYKIDKGEKKLGYYETTFSDAGVSANSYGAANRLEMFSTKNVIWEKEGLKKVHFSKNKKYFDFIVATKLSALDAQTRKSYDRKFKKVKNDSMLFITKEGKKRIELFNKRKIVIKTLDELLSDIYNDKLTYDKFILFEKLGVMKMVASVSKSDDAVIITNASKHKPYMKISLTKNLPIKIESLLSNWSATLQKSGVAEIREVSFQDIIKKSLSDDLKGATLSLLKVKKTKISYELSGKLAFTLTDNISSKKSYKQKEYCKKLLKKSHFKLKKISVKSGTCSAEFKKTLKLKQLKKTLLESLTKQYPQLKMTKKIKFNKNNITYEVL